MSGGRVYGGTMKAGGARLEAPFCHVFHVRDGTIVSFQQYAASAQWTRPPVCYDLGDLPLRHLKEQPRA